MDMQFWLFVPISLLAQLPSPQEQRGFPTTEKCLINYKGTWEVYATYVFLYLSSHPPFYAPYSSAGQDCFPSKTNILHVLYPWWFDISGPLWGQVMVSL